MSAGIKRPSFRLFIRSTFVTPWDFNSFWISSSSMFASSIAPDDTSWIICVLWGVTFTGMSFNSFVLYSNLSLKIFFPKWTNSCLPLFIGFTDMQGPPIPSIALLSVKMSDLWVKGLWLSSAASTTRNLGHLSSLGVEVEHGVDVCCLFMLIVVWFWWRLTVCHQDYFHKASD